MYDFKMIPEIGWAIAISVAIAGATILVDLEPETITNWQTWGVGAAGALVRAVGAAVLTVLRPKASD